MQGFGAEVMEVSRQYIRENVDKDGNVRQSNLSESQKAGLRDIENMMKEKKHIVIKTDKSDRLCLLSENDYVKTGEPHVTEDEVKNLDDAKTNEERHLELQRPSFLQIVGTVMNRTAQRD